MKIIIFGASGDLAKRKLFPALSRIDLEGVEIVGYARTRYDVEFAEVLQEVGNYSAEFLSKVTYIKGPYGDLSRLQGVTDGETVLYFSVPPSVYGGLLKEISGLEHGAVAVEKPYGESIGAFMAMKEFELDRVVFIDHYLLKPLVVAMPGIIRGSPQLQEVMSNRYVKSVEIVSKEVIGGEGRHYFDKNGIVKDIVQSHMAELLGVVAADVTKASRAMEAAARMEVFKVCTVDMERSIFGQYDSYHKEVHKDSSTETFCMLCVHVNSPRWSKVPFVVVAGKGMDEKRTEVVLELRKDAFAKCIELFCVERAGGGRTIHTSEICAVRVVFNVYSECEVFLEIVLEDESVRYVLCDRKAVDDMMHETYDGLHDHEIIFNNLIHKKSFNSVSASEAELLWRLFDPVLCVRKEDVLFYYPKGIDMPKEAEDAIAEIKGH